jgi:hypothetical protein
MEGPSVFFLALEQKKPDDAQSTLTDIQKSVAGRACWSLSLHHFVHI